MQEQSGMHRSHHRCVHFPFAAPQHHYAADIPTMKRPTMFPRALGDRRAFDLAQAMLDGFNRHYQLFTEANASAKTRFEAADWHGQQYAQRERIEFYDKRVD